MLQPLILGKRDFNKEHSVEQNRVQQINHLIKISFLHKINLFVCLGFYVPIKKKSPLGNMLGTCGH